MKLQLDQIRVCLSAMHLDNFKACAGDGVISLLDKVERGSSWNSVLERLET